MQGLADGYFILPYTIGDFLARLSPADRLSPDHRVFRQTEQAAVDRIDKLLSIRGRRSANSFHRELGELLWNQCGMSRNESGLKQALTRIPELREEFWSNLQVPGASGELNQSLEHAGRVADFLCRFGSDAPGGFFFVRREPVRPFRRGSGGRMAALKWARRRETFHENVSIANRSYAAASCCR